MTLLVKELLTLLTLPLCTFGQYMYAQTVFVILPQVANLRGDVAALAKERGTAPVASIQGMPYTLIHSSIGN